MKIVLELNDRDLKRYKRLLNKALNKDGVSPALMELLLALQGSVTTVDDAGNPVRKGRRKRGRRTAVGVN